MRIFAGYPVSFRQTTVQEKASAVDEADAPPKGDDVDSLRRRVRKAEAFVTTIGASIECLSDSTPGKRNMLSLLAQYYDNLAQYPDAKDASTRATNLRAAIYRMDQK